MFLSKALEMFIHMENVIDELTNHEAATVRSLGVAANENV
jgi:hypothetical protein